jgi:hypothetical protein
MSLNFGQSLFPPRGEPIISYDYFDISSGTGYDIYYGIRKNASAYATTTNSSVGSTVIETNTGSGDAPNSTPTFFFEQDFDITFNLPRNIKGEIIINVPIGISNRDGASADFDVFTSVLVYHYDGSTETQIGSTATSESLKLRVQNGESESYVACLTVTAPLTHFKKGETLRFTVKGNWTGQAANVASSAAIGHDPLNRGQLDLQTSEFAYPVFEGPSATNGNLTGHRSVMSFHVPFKIDVT